MLFKRPSCVKHLTPTTVNGQGHKLGCDMLYCFQRHTLCWSPAQIHWQNYDWDWDTLNQTTCHPSWSGGFVNIKPSLHQQERLFTAIRYTTEPFIQKFRQRKGSEDDDGGQLSCNWLLNVFRVVELSVWSQAIPSVLCQTSIDELEKQ